MKKLLEEFKDTLSKEESPKIIIIDELDRCRPDYAIQLLEIIKHIFDVKNIIFLFLINREQLESIVSTIYMNSNLSNKYFEKFYDVELNLPKANYEELNEPEFKIVNDFKEYKVDKNGYSNNRDLVIQKIFLDIAFVIKNSSWLENNDISIRNIKKLLKKFNILKDSLIEEEKEQYILILALITYFFIKELNLKAPRDNRKIIVVIIEKYLKKYSIQYIRKNKSINSNAVNITTYYSSKGTENKVIFIPNIDELSPNDLVEFYPDKTSYEILDELRKLLYIGMTRATEVLVMSSLKEETEYLKELLNTFDFQEDFINIDSDINEFYNVFNSEINKNENIEKNINKFTEIKELIQEEKVIDIAIKNELGNLKNIDNTDKNIKIEEQIEEIFPLAQKSTKIGLIKAEKLFLRADKEEEYLGTEAFEYLKSLECEIRTYYITIHEKYLKDNYSKNEKLSIILNELKDYTEFKTAVQNCIKHKVFEKRNDLAHEYNEYNYDNLLKVRELVKEKLLPKFIKAFKKFNTNKEIEEFVIIGKLETEYNKIDIKRKKYYTYYITDGNNNEFPALSENKYEQNKTYKLSCNKLMLKGNEYYRIVSAT